MDLLFCQTCCGTDFQALGFVVCAIGLTPVIAACPPNGPATDRKGMNNNRISEVG